MSYKLILPDGYKSGLSVRQTEVVIKDIKDYFERALADALNLTRVSAPLFVRAESGLNDNLNGVERPVSFDLLETGTVCEIIHSLAKWKRQALKTYGFKVGEGLYTDMNAVRRDELTDNLHSIYVDQWDWEMVIGREQRCTDFLKQVVRKIYGALLATEKAICSKYGLNSKLVPEITFVDTQELEDRYPDHSPKERETLAAREHGSIFLMQIGGRMHSGEKHDGRAPDYDDWSLNGDIIVYYPLLDTAMELSSMGIRVDEKSLLSQLNTAGCIERLALPFQGELAAGKLPLTIGGGLGQSRICMYLLNCAHIGEVQSSVWPEADRIDCERAGINLL